MSERWQYCDQSTSWTAVFRWNDKKNSRLAKLALRIWDLGKFWPILAQLCFGFCEGKFFPVRGNTSHVQGSISNARRTFEPKTHPSSPLKPQNLAKNVTWVANYGQIFVCHFRLKAHLTSGQNIPNPKNRLPKSISSWSYKSLNFEFVCSQIPPFKFWSC